MSDLVDSWTLALDAEGRSPKTVRIYVTAARSLEEVTGKPVENITPHDLRAWQIAMRGRWSATTINMHYRALRVLFVWLVAEGEIASNPCERVKAPKVDSALPRTATADEVDRLLRSIPKDRRRTNARDRALICVLADSGLRRGELLGLRVSDVDLRARRVSVVGKMGARTVPLSSRACAEIDRYMRVAGIVEGGLWGETFGITGIRLMLNRRCQKAGIRALNPHSFRHGLVEHWLTEGGSETGLMDVCGWNSSAMVRVYARGSRAARAQSEYGRIIG